MKLTGGCLCGAVRYETTEPPVWSHHCHCSRCRRSGGGAFASNAFFAKRAFAFTAGREHVRSFEVPDADFFTHFFCERCGSTLPFPNEAHGLVGVPMGTLDADPGLAPKAHIWTDSKAPWHEITDDLPRHPERLGSGQGRDEE